MNNYISGNDRENLYEKMTEEGYRPTAKELGQLFLSILREPRPEPTKDPCADALQRGWDHMTESRGWK